MPRTVEYQPCETCGQERMLVMLFERNCDYCGALIHDRKYVLDCGEFFCGDQCHQAFLRNGDSKQCTLTKEQLDEELEEMERDRATAYFSELGTNAIIEDMERRKLYNDITIKQCLRKVPNGWKDYDVQYLRGLEICELRTIMEKISAH